MAIKTVLRGNGTQIFANSSGLVTISYDVVKNSKFATRIDDRMIIKAGTAVPSNDGDCVGLVFEDWDVTDSGGQIPIVVGGYVNEFYLPASIAALAKAALKNVVFLNSTSFVADEVYIASTASVKASAFVPATGATLTVALTGDTFKDSAKTLSYWRVIAPKGYYLASVTVSTTTAAVLKIKALVGADTADKDMKVDVAVIGAALTNGSSPAQIRTDLFAAEAATP